MSKSIGDSSGTVLLAPPVITENSIRCENRLAARIGRIPTVANDGAPRPEPRTIGPYESCHLDTELCRRGETDAARSRSVALIAQAVSRS
jgi:hypothetical protein